MLNGLEENPQANILDLHREFYSGLLDCQTLEEAKDLYPEFEKIIDAKDLDLSKKPSNNIFCQIKKGNVKGFKLEETSLKMLKSYYAQLIPLNNEYIKENFNMAFSAFKTLISTLNIPMDSRYLKLIGLKMKSENMAKVWQDDDYKVKTTTSMKKSFNTEKYKKGASIRSKKSWQNPAYRANMIASIRKAKQDPQYQARVSKASTKLWQDEEYRKKMKINSLASAIAWDIHPYAKKVYKEIAHNFPELKEALENRRKGIKLTQRQENILGQYYKTCAQHYPDLKKEIGQIQKNLLKEWGFYKKDRDIDKILEYIEKTYG